MKRLTSLTRLTLVAGLFLAVVLHLRFLYSFLKKRRLLAALLSSFVTPVTAAASSLPNVVMIMSDDLGWSDIAVIGSSVSRNKRLSLCMKTV